MRTSTVLYFAYGSNMNSGRIKTRIGRLPERMAAKLFGYKLVFNKPSGIDDTAYANIEKTNHNHYIEGFVYYLKPADIFVIDKYEGYPKSYSRENLFVELNNGQTQECLTYIANITAKRERAPRFDYAYHVFKGAQDLSDEYFKTVVNKLQSLYGMDINEIKKHFRKSS
jgi:cation transport regulator ChaC